MAENGEKTPDYDESDMAILCQGYPRCNLIDQDEIMKAQTDGCLWCVRIYFDADGKRTVITPGEA